MAELSSVDFPLNLGIVYAFVIFLLHFTRWVHFDILLELSGRIELLVKNLILEFNSRRVFARNAPLSRWLFISNIWGVHWRTKFHWWLLAPLVICFICITQDLLDIWLLLNIHIFKHIRAAVKLFLYFCHFHFHLFLHFFIFALPHLRFLLLFLEITVEPSLVH